MNANTNELSKKLNTLVAESRSRQLQRVEARERDMEQINARLDRYHSLTRTWLKHEVLPRMDALSEILPPGKPPRVGANALAAFLERGATEEFPASAEVVFQFAHDPDVQRAHLTMRVRIIPVLMKYDHEGTIELDVDEAETPKLIEFIDDRICQFAADYLRVREPDSRYQRDQLVTDPVCGMTFHRWEAASSAEHGRNTFHFCTDECRGRFEADPDHYAG